MLALKVVGRGQRVWDVENGEAHVRATLDAWLNEKGAYLRPDQYERALQFLWGRFWQLSGLAADWRTPRVVWELCGFVAPRSADSQFEPIKPLQFPSPERAERAVALLEARGLRLFLVSIEPARPRGAYDPSFGQAFSTYSRRILTLQVPDWYRSDPEFGDTRYGSNRGREESLEALAERHRRDDDGEGPFLDRHSPGSRLDFVDELNTHAYQESIEEVLTREAVGL